MVKDEKDKGLITTTHIFPIERTLTSQGTPWSQCDKERDHDVLRGLELKSRNQKRCMTAQIGVCQKLAKSEVVNKC